jgi:hypothetical protein
VGVPNPLHLGPDILPQADREEGMHLAYLLTTLDSYTKDFQSALLLTKYCNIEMNKIPASEPKNPFMRWHVLAMRGAALSLFNFRYIMIGIGHSIHACPTLEAKIGVEKMRKIKRLFNSYFPHHEDVRHAISHAGEIQHTRANLDASRYEGVVDLGGVPAKGIAGGSFTIDRTITLINRKKLVSLEVSEKTLERLTEVAEAIHDLFRALAK